MIVNGGDFANAAVGKAGGAGPAGRPQPGVAVRQIIRRQFPPGHRVKIMPADAGTQLELVFPIRSQLPALAQITLQGKAGGRMFRAGADPQQPAVRQSRPWRGQSFLIFLMQVPVRRFRHNRHGQSAAAPPGPVGHRSRRRCYRRRLHLRPVVVQDGNGGRGGYSGGRLCHCRDCRRQFARLVGGAAGQCQ